MFRDVFLSNIKATTLIAYIVNLYSFNLITEILLLATTCVFTLLFVSAKSLGERGDINLNTAKTIINLSNIILFVTFLIYLYGFIYWFVINWSNILSVNIFMALLFPIVMTILIIPFIYATSIYSLYEQILTRLRSVNAKKNLSYYRKRKWWIIRMCGLNLRKIAYFNKTFHIYWQEDNEVFRQELLDINKKYNSYM